MYTRNQIRYNFRLFGWAVFMWAGNTLLGFLLQSKDIQVNNNIFLTLAMGVLVPNIIAYAMKRLENQGNRILKYLRILSGMIVLVTEFMFTEGGIIVMPFMLLPTCFGIFSKDEMQYISSMRLFLRYRL